MRDPPARNIDGEKVITHSVEHKVDWGHVALGVGILALAFIVHRAFLRGSEDDEAAQSGGI